MQLRIKYIWGAQVCCQSAALRNDAVFFATDIIQRLTRQKDDSGWCVGKNLEADGRVRLSSISLKRLKETAEKLCLESR
jgi:hypothetical protein